MPPGREDHFSVQKEGDAHEPSFVDLPRHLDAQQRRHVHRDFCTCLHTHQLAYLMEVLAQLSGFALRELVEVDVSIELVHLGMKSGAVGVEIGEQDDHLTADVCPYGRRDERDEYKSSILHY